MQTCYHSDCASLRWSSHYRCCTLFSCSTSSRHSHDEGEKALFDFFILPNNQLSIKAYCRISRATLNVADCAPQMQGASSQLFQIAHSDAPRCLRYMRWLHCSLACSHPRNLIQDPHGSIEDI
jgi:hypothetical protein